MDTQTSQVLNYASQAKPLKPLPFFRSLAFLFALCGLAYNLWNIHDLIWSLESTRNVYDRLMVDPRAFGREIKPDIIARLEFPWWNWLSHGALAVASFCGMLLALHLLIAVCTWRKNIDKTTRYLKDYARFKLTGAIITTICYFAARTTDTLFWTYATRHTPIGTSDLIFVATSMLAIGSIFSWWWIARDYQPAIHKLKISEK